MTRVYPDVWRALRYATARGARSRSAGAATQTRLVATDEAQGESSGRKWGTGHRVRQGEGKLG
eukprot:5459020-Pyramimonas_sp.AAC.2